MYRNHIYINLFLVGLIVIVLLPFINTGVATGDDLSFLVSAVKNKLGEGRLGYAHTAGRFYFLVTLPFYRLPYVFDNLLIANGVNLAFVAIGVVLLGAIIKKLFCDKWMGLLAMVVFLAFLSIKGNWNPITNLRWYFTFTFDLLLLSFYLLLSYRNSNKRVHLIISVISFAVALLFYEVYLLYLPLLIIFAVKPEVYRSEKKLLKKCLWVLRFSWPFLLVAFVYLSIYFGFRVLYPATYAGTSFAPDLKIYQSYQAMLRLARGSYPLYFIAENKMVFYEGSEKLFNHYSTLKEFLLSIKALSLIKSFIVAFLFYYFLSRAKRSNIKALLLIMFVAVLYIYLPHLPLALSSKYTKIDYLNNYLTTYFGYFSMILFLTGLFSLVPFIHKKLLKEVVNGILVFIVFSGSLLTDYINDSMLTGLRGPYNRQLCIDTFIETDEFKQLPSKTKLYSPNLYSKNYSTGGYSNQFKWEYYTEPKTGKDVSFLRHKQQLLKAMEKGSTQNFYLKYDYDYKSFDQFMVLAPLSQKSAISNSSDVFLADSMTCFYYSDNKEYTISFGLNDDNPPPYFYSVNGKEFETYEPYVYFTCRQVDFKKNFVPVKIVSKNIDVPSVFVNPMRSHTDSKINLR